MKRSRLKIFLIAIYLSSCSAQFVDEFQDFDTACYEEGAFFCFEGGCVSSDKYCDSMYDCSDGSDENFCTSHTADAQYCNETHQYLCADSRKCVPAAWVCNNETDCDDGSDEANCTSPHISENSTCKGFLCDVTRCISTLWMCDGKYDCDDRSDEDIQETCRHALHTRKVNDALNCPSIIPHDAASMEYPCLDTSFCIPYSRMCDGLRDCRDGSDEGPFCTTWHTMCSNHSCGSPDAFCVPQREGPACQCPALRQYVPARARCASADLCARTEPVCSHTCLPRDDHFSCQCDDGYIADYANYLCFAPDPEPILFFSTRNDIRYIKVHSKQLGIITSEVRKAHGVSFDGSWVYWVETEQGHQSIIRAHFENIADTKQVIAALGLMEPADVAVDHLGGNIYLSDSDGQAIFVCRANGTACMTLPTKTTHPRFITLNHRKGEMYWADWTEKPIINMARMDGKGLDYLVHDLESFATGLALDAPNDRLYFVDQTIRVVRLSDKKVYTLFDEPFHHPYALAVFESTVFWSDWTSNTIQTADKIHGSSTNRHILLNLDVPVFDMHIYHPVLINRVRNPCEHHTCSHLCLVTGPATHVCGCPNGMELRGDDCQHPVGYRPRYLLVGAGAALARIQYDSLGNADASKVYLDVGRLQAMAHDSIRDILYIYDGRRKTISYINMSNYVTGLAHLFVYEGMENVIDMDYDFVSDNLYVLDVTRRVVEVISVRNKMKAFVYFFKEEEIPISLCVIPQYGMMLVAVMENEDTNLIYVDSMGLDGSDRKRFPLTNLEGPYIRMRYSPEMDLVYFSDEGRRVIEQIHPSGTGREVFRQHLTGVASLSVSDTHVFWTDRRTNRLYWAHPHDATHKIRRLELSIYPNVTHLHTHVTSPPPDTRAFKTHKCFDVITPCSHICVQRYHSELAPRGLDYQCLCPPGLFLANDRCIQKAHCSRFELYCHKSNTCFSKFKKCDGNKDCEFGEDEIGCPATTESHTVCDWYEVNCHGTCISSNAVCKDNLPPEPKAVECGPTEQRCGNSSVCVERALACDGHADCPDGADELPELCGTMACFDTEFMCDSGSCIPVMWRCDRSEDCPDGSDEIGCTNSTCEEGSFACGSGECVELARRCDDQPDCADGSDEDDCAAVDPLDEPEPASACMPWEFVCEHNKTICLPYTARCNAKVDCPGGSDEDGCDLRCAPNGGFGCKQEYRCIGLQHVCNGWRDCTDGSDETLDACARVNKTGVVLRSRTWDELECRHGYRCNTSQCIDWSQVCDSKKDCADGSDENGLCSTPCSLKCSHSCRRSPSGEQCTCPAGYQLVNTTCVDLDECADPVCSHVCHNLPGSFACSCYWGYALRPDRRSCKAPRGEMTALYAGRGGVWALSRAHFNHLVYSDPDNHTISDLAYNVRKEKMYIASYDGGKLLEVMRRADTNLVLATNVVSNVGKPTKLSVDWVTDNVYFADGSPTAPAIRVCHVAKKRCARLKRLTPGTNVTALAVDPANRRLFYCITNSQEAVVRATNLSGRTTMDLAAVPSCAGLAVNSFSRTLYIASPKTSAILQINYEGNALLTVLNVDPHIRKPHSLALFEDHIYFVSGTNLNRCQLFGTKSCTTYGKTQAEPTAFVIHHESTQRDDVKNGCYGFACPNLCVLGERGPSCVCQDGSAPKSGLCPVLADNEMAMFNGRLQTVSRSHPVSTTLVVVVVVLFAVYLAAFVRYQRKQRKNNSPGNYLQVRYDNAAGLTQVTTPIIEMPSTSATGHEFINPLQFARNVWRDSFYGKPKPVGTAGLLINLQQDLSDTESDLDVRETRRLFCNK